MQWSINIKMCRLLSIEEENKIVDDFIAKRDSNSLYLFIKNGKYSLSKICVENGYIIENNDRYFLVTENKIERMIDIKITHKLEINSHSSVKEEMELNANSIEWKELFIKLSKK